MYFKRKYSFQSTIKRGACSLLFFCANLCFVTPAQTSVQIDIPDSDLNFRLSSFGTAAVVFSDASGSAMRRDSSKQEVVLKGEPAYLIDSLLGLQINAHYKKWSAVTQLKVRDQDKKDLNDYLALAFLSYQFTPSTSARAGLLPIDAYMLSESRDVSYTYPWVRPDLNFYTPVVLNNFKGADISYRHYLGLGMLEWRLGGGTFTSHNALTQRTKIYLEFKDFITANLLYDNCPVKLRLSLLSATVEKMAFVKGFDDLVKEFVSVQPKLPPSAVSLFGENSLAGSKVVQYALSATYDGIPWLLQSEISHINYKSDNPLRLYSGYVSAAYRFRQWASYAVISRIFSGGRKGSAELIAKIDPNTADEVEEMVGLVTRRTNQTTVSLGLRWNVNNNIALKAQWDKHRLGQYAKYSWLAGQGSPSEKYVNILTLSMDFLF